MKRKLFTQIKNEWRENVWMVLELTIVIGAIWVILALCWETGRAKLIPKGFEASDVFAVNIRAIDSTSSEYENPTDTGSYDYLGARNALLDNIRQHPLVEYVGMGENAYPYDMSAINNSMVIFDVKDTVYYGGNERRMTPDLVKVFRLESLTGKTQEELMNLLHNGKILLSDNPQYAENGRDPMDLIGKRMVYPYDSTTLYEVGDVIRHIRRNEFEYPLRGTIIKGISEENGWFQQLAIKVKEGKENEFLEAFKTTPELRRYGNVYLTHLQRFENMRNGVQHGYVTDLASKLILAFFLLVVIFLGLLGTFWFRMQQRVSEVAIRMVCGATRNQIFRRVISEGLILLFLGSIFISIILWPLRNKINLELDWMNILGCELVAILLVAFGVVVSLWWPARKIMNIEPAVAVKEE